MTMGKQKDSARCVYRVKGDQGKLMLMRKPTAACKNVHAFIEDVKEEKRN